MKKIELTQGLHALVDDDDFLVLSKFKWHAVKMGYTAYAVRAERVRKNKQVRIWMHRQILGILPGSCHCDHINGNGLDNRRSNLRTCSQDQNVKNRKIPKSNTSGYKGVSVSKYNGKFRSSIALNKKDIHIGLFDCIIEAAKAYDAMAKKLHGEFANINFPDN